MNHLIRQLLSLGLLLSVTMGSVAMAENQNPKVSIETNKGTIVVELFADKAPETVANFMQYMNDGFFDGTIFHRVIPGFMIQGGGFTADMSQKPTRDPIKNEAANGLSNEVGTLAMARTPNPHSATAQFFINVKHNRFLDFSSETQQGWGYAVFGKVVEGMDVVQAIEGVATGNKGMHQDVPTEPVVMTKVSPAE
jgi:peptidyl-prolyl cis-trans isomerase B (cyclophilin B)